ncbi:MAG: helix-turn-helix domain-containing protein [Marinosulfonomonas sp.]|nr:helix-turn-helix domain-containing protein [Marinosulfonomonas sp.]
MNNPPINLIILDYPGASLAAVAGLQEMFAHVARLHERDGMVPITLTVVTADSLPTTPPNAVILPPAFGNEQYLNPQRPVLDWLRMLPDDCIMASACAGAFHLGAAGVLEQRRVTTHWALESELQDRFPNTAVDVDEILISDGRVITAGGLLSWVDLALELIARFSSLAVMREVGRHFVVDTGRREQRYYRAFNPPLNHGDTPIEQAQFLIERTFTARIRISELARTVALTERTFLRRFERATGHTPLAYVQHLRIQSAQRALENTAAAIEQISYAVGYENANAFRKLFKRHTGLSPSQYRQRLKR